MAANPGSAYRNPLRDIQDLSPNRVDQGVDYDGTGPIYALGSGVITSVYNSGWPGGAFIAEQLSDGPYAGDYTYQAEDITPAVTVGQKVTSATVTGYLYGGGDGIETGWADPPGTGYSLAYASGQWNPSAADPATGYGTNFSNLLQALGAPPGTGGSGAGTAPPTKAGFDWNPLSWPGALIRTTVTGPVDAATSAVGSGLSDVGNTLKAAAIIGPIVLAAGAVAVFGFIRMTGREPHPVQAAQNAGTKAAVDAAL